MNNTTKKTRGLRFATTINERQLKSAIDHLRTARAYARAAGCSALVRKIQSAIASAGGAERHMYRRLNSSREGAK